MPPLPPGSLVLLRADVDQPTQFVAAQDIADLATSVIFALDAVAGMILGGHRVVRSDAAGKMVYADKDDDPTLLARVVGITQGAAAADDPVIVQTYGPFSEPSWTWDIDQGLFLGGNGLIVQAPPTTGALLRVGYPTLPTDVFVDLGELFILA